MNSDCIRAVGVAANVNARQMSEALRESLNSPGQDEAVTGADVTQHLPQLELQLANGTHSVLEREYERAENTHCSIHNINTLCHKSRTVIQL